METIHRPVLRSPQITPLETPCDQFPSIDSRLASLYEFARTVPRQPAASLSKSSTCWTLWAARQRPICPRPGRPVHRGPAARSVTPYACGPAPGCPQHVQPGRHDGLSPNVTVRLRRVSQWVGRIPKWTDKKHFSRKEIRSVLDLMHHDIEATEGWARWRARRLYALTATVAYCGLRRNEALFLHAVDIDLADRVINLTDRGRSGGQRLKTASSEAPVPIPDALAEILSDWLKHRLDHPADFQFRPAPWLIPCPLNRRSNWTEGPPERNLSRGCKPSPRELGSTE